MRQRLAEFLTKYKAYAFFTAMLLTVVNLVLPMWWFLDLLISMVAVYILCCDIQEERFHEDSRVLNGFFKRQWDKILLTPVA